MSTLRALGRSVTAQVISKDGTSTLQLKLGANVGRHSFAVRTTRTHLSYPLAAGFIEEAKHAAGPWLLFAPYIPGAIGQHLVSHHVSYVDAVGNCHVEARETLLAHVEGRKPVREPNVRTPGVNGPLTILRTPGALAYRGAQPHLAHPLLVYSELLTSPEPHALRLAKALREQYLVKVA